MSASTSPHSSSFHQFFQPINLSSFLRKIGLAGFHILFLLVPMFFLTVNEELFEFNKMVLTYAIASVIVGAWAMRSIVEQRIIWTKTPIDIPILFFLCSQVISTFFSIDPHTSWFGYYTRFNGGLLSIITYIALFYSWINTVKKSELTKFLFSILLGAFAVTLYAIPEHFAISPSCTLIHASDRLKTLPSFLSLLPDAIQHPDQYFTTDCWSERTNPKYRIFGTFGQPNWLAAYAILLLPLSLAFLLIRSQKIHQKTRKLPIFSSLLPTAYYLLPFSLYTTLLFTKSRSGFLGFLASVFVAGFILLSNKILNSRTPAQKHTRTNTLNSQLLTFNFSHLLPIAYCLLPFFLITVFFGTPYTPNIFQLTNQPPTDQPNSPNPPNPPPPDPINRLDEGGTDSGEIRKIVWSGAINVWKRYPIFGSGVETFAYSYYRDRPVEHNNVSEWDFLYNKAHNEWLNYLATTGTVGFVAYLTLLIWVGVWLLLTTMDNKREFSQRLLSLAILTGLAGLHVSNFFGFSTVVVSTYMFLFPAFVLTPDDQNLDQNSSKSDKLSITQLLSLAFAMMVTVSLLSKTWNVWHTDYLLAQAKKQLNQSLTATAFDTISTAIAYSPNEPVLYEQQSRISAQFALETATTGNATKAAELANTALESIDLALSLNPVHLNFYRTRTSVLINLAQIQPSLYLEAIKTLQVAQTLAPTDAKLLYHQGILEYTLDATNSAILSLEKALELKPNYLAVQQELEKIRSEQENVEDGIDNVVK